MSKENGENKHEKHHIPTPRVRPRSPRAAAVAGIIFSVLMMVSMFLTRSLRIIDVENISLNSLDTWADSVSLVLTMLPFAGISFLWFTGVMRDRLADQEDQFFSTIFFGSGLLFVALLFIWGATIGTIFRIYPISETVLLDNDTIIYGFTFVDELMGNYGLRLAGVYMFSSASLWLRTGVMPRWLIIVTFIVALVFLLFAGILPDSRFAFPAWVMMVSVYILVANKRLKGPGETG